VNQWPPLADALLASQLIEELPGAYECPRCQFGPILHGHCSDLRAHHNQRQSAGHTISNACPRCDFFVAEISGWPAWKGVLPEGTASAVSLSNSGSSKSALPSSSSSEATKILASYGKPSLRDRAFWQASKAWEKVKTAVEVLNDSWSYMGPRRALERRNFDRVDTLTVSC
jgi:hypothetical protein